MLQRVTGISHPDQKCLEEYIALVEEDRKLVELGKNQELFHCSPLFPGKWVICPHGDRVIEKLGTFIQTEYRRRGYDKVRVPISTCRGHCMMFDHTPHSYTELPLRFADSEANGLTRDRKFQQDDAHIFCRESQIKDEVKSVLKFMDYAYGVFGFTYELKLSTRPEKYFGDLEAWDKAEKALEGALDEFGKPWQINEADGAFYGPKVDISFCDEMKSKFQCAALQLDFQLPQEFNLSYSGEDETKRDRPVMIHQAILGSVERMFSVLLEHYKGKWPFWLSPRQAIVCPVSDKSQAYGQQVKDKIIEAGFYVDIDTSDRTIQKKVLEAQLAQYNYILLVDEEANTGKVSVQARDKQEHLVQTIPDLLEHFKEEVQAFH